MENLRPPVPLSLPAVNVTNASYEIRLVNFTPESPFHIQIIRKATGAILWVRAARFYRSELFQHPKVAIIRRSGSIPVSEVWPWPNNSSWSAPSCLVVTCTGSARIRTTRSLTTWTTRCGRYLGATNLPVMWVPSFSLPSIDRYFKKIFLLWLKNIYSHLGKILIAKYDHSYPILFGFGLEIWCATRLRYPFSFAFNWFSTNDSPYYMSS